eukprot:10508354-Ditylum_brightwellii.AAC.2
MMNKKKAKDHCLEPKHVKDVWSDARRKEINIPRIIDIYNHRMGGVDISDQRIPYDHPNVHCCHNWAPIFLKTLSIMCNNAYDVHKDQHGINALSHKRLTMEWVKIAMQRTHLAFYEHNDSEPSLASISSSTSIIDNRLCKGHCHLLDFDNIFYSFPQRKKGPRKLHKRVASEKNCCSACLYCSALFNEKKQTGISGFWQKIVCQTGM